MPLEVSLTCDNSWLCQPTPAVQPHLYWDIKCAQALMCTKSSMGDKGGFKRSPVCFVWISVTTTYIIRSSRRHTRQCACLCLGCLLVTIRELYCRAPWQHQGSGGCTGLSLSRGIQLSTAAEKTHSSWIHSDNKSSKLKSSATSSQLLCPSRTVQPHLSGLVQFSLSYAVEELCFIILHNMKI